MSQMTRSRVRHKVQRHRNRLRKAGLRPVQIWVPDMRSDEFRRLAHRESLAIARSRRERADQRFVDGFSVWPNDE